MGCDPETTDSPSVTLPPISEDVAAHLEQLQSSSVPPGDPRLKTVIGGKKSPPKFPGPAWKAWKAALEDEYAAYGTYIAASKRAAGLRDAAWDEESGAR